MTAKYISSNLNEIGYKNKKAYLLLGLPIKSEIMHLIACKRRPYILLNICIEGQQMYEAICTCHGKMAQIQYPAIIHCLRTKYVYE